MYRHIFIIIQLFVLLVKDTESICLAKLVPDHIRLAFAGENGVSIGWHTYSCPMSRENPNANPTVIYGLSPTQLNFTSVNGNSSNYDSRNPLKVSWFYHVELINLLPSTIYYYQIVAAEYVPASSIYSFRTAPVLGSQTNPINILSYADLGVDGIMGDIVTGKHLFEKAIYAIEKMMPKADFVLHHGDVCYADNTPVIVLKTYEQAFDYCQHAMTNITSQIFYMTTVGNHEINCTEANPLFKFCSPSHRNQIPYSHRFYMPSKYSNGHLNSWYSFNYGFVHVISISCESDFPNSPSPNLIDSTTQVNWLRNDLASVNRSVTPWVIVQCHRPWKGSISKADIAEHGILNCPSCQAAFESLLLEYNVDIYLTGHVHWYERICLNGTVNTTEYTNPDGPVYLIDGSIGSPEGSDVLYNRSSESCFLNNDPGFGFLTIKDPSHATYTFYRVNDTAILDQINITKKR